MMQARRAVDHDFAAAKTVYEQQLQALRLSVQVAASGTTIQRYLQTGDQAALYAYLRGIHRDAGFDFLSLTDAGGRVILRVSRPGYSGRDASAIAVVKAALAGKVAAATEVLSAAQLGDEDPSLPARARTKTGNGEVNEGMTQIAAAPVEGPGTNVLGVLYGGLLLNRNSAIVDRVWTLLFRGDRFKDADSGSVTIFRNGYRIATNVRTVAGERAVGTAASAEVREAVLKRGALWRGRAFVVKQWYISEYDPVRNYAGDVIGMLSVGVLESTYTTIRNSVILSFFLLATIGFLMIIGITYYMIRNITRPSGRWSSPRGISAPDGLTRRFNRIPRARSPYWPTPSTPCSRASGR
jgi:two-component system NtrC family sensor kinase